MKTEVLTLDTYNEVYFNYQRKMGEFGGWANTSKFKKYIKPTDKVIDFGCGGGYLLKNLNCADKIGIEVNENARLQATSNGVYTVNSTDEIEDEWADVIVSHHALEHTIHPFDEITKLKNKLKKGGSIIFIVPSEGVFYSFKHNDPNHHLYTWSPMCLGNLFSKAGFKVQESRAIIHNWPPKYILIAKMGRYIFDVCSTIYGFLMSPKLSQTRIIATKL